MTRRKSRVSRSRDSPDRVRRKIEIIRQELAGEIDAGLAHMEGQIGSISRGPISLIVSPLLRGLFHFTALPAAKRRGLRRLDIYFRLLQDGADLDRAIARHLEAYLETNEAWVRARKDHPRTPELKEYLIRELKAHLRLGEALLKGDGDSYPGLVRSAFPKRKTIEALMSEQFDAVKEALDLVREAEGLMDIPSSLRSHVDRLLDNALEYVQGRSRERLDRIYA